MYFMSIITVAYVKAFKHCVFTGVKLELETQYRQTTVVKLCCFLVCHLCVRIATLANYPGSISC